MNIGFFPSISTEHLALLACLAAAAGVCLFVLGLRRYARKVSGRDVPASSVRDASPGLRKVSGRATGPYTIMAPISGEPSFLNRTTIWQLVKSGQKSEWKKVAEQTLHLLFFVEDTTGQLLVDSSDAEFDWRPDLCREYAALTTWADLDNVPAPVSVFLARHGIELNRPTRIEESMIKPGATVFVSGTVMRNLGIQVRPFLSDDHQRPDDMAAGADRESADCDSAERGNRGGKEKTQAPAPEPEVVMLTSEPPPASTVNMTQQGKIAAALSRAGMGNADSWAMPSVRTQDDSESNVAIEGTASQVAAANPEASSAAAKNVQDDPVKSLNEPAFNLSPRLVLMKGSGDNLLVISGEKHTAANPVSWASVAMIVTGTALALLGFCVLLAERQLL